ncbi:MAG: hypothetical protein ABI162_13280 [Luteolibacter sp.]
MKTKLTHLAAALVAVVSLTPAAFAGPKYTARFSNGAKSQAAVSQTAASESCKMDHGQKRMDCCSNKIASTAPLGRSGQIHTKKVHTCTM